MDEQFVNEVLSVATYQTICPTLYLTFKNLYPERLDNIHTIMAALIITGKDNKATATEVAKVLELAFREVLFALQLVNKVLKVDIPAPTSENIH